MQNPEKTSLLTIALLAAFADGTQGEAERAEVRRVAESLASPDLNLPALVQDVLLQRASTASAAAGLTSAALRQLAYELAVGVCDADGLRNDQETRFLTELGQALGLSGPQMAEPTLTADALATAPLDEVAAGTSPGAAPAAPRSDAELDRMVLNYAIMNGALELLPQSMASMAIIPLQMKMVYRIGKAHGYELDRGHIKDLLAAMGVGLTGQYLEDVGRKLIGGLFGKVAGGMAGALARGATGAAHHEHADAQGRLHLGPGPGPGASGAVHAADRAAGAQGGRGPDRADGAHELAGAEPAAGRRLGPTRPAGCA
jgi:uncharacterized protein (DUF697 family)/tellurite resistance protein